MATIAKRREVAGLHQLQGLTQTQICKKTGYGHKLVKLWMNVPWLSPDSAFERSPGGSKNAQKFNKKAGVFKDFEREFRLSNPRNISEAIARAKKIWEAIPQANIQKYIRGYGDRLHAIIDSNGDATSWMGKKWMCE